MTDLDELRDDVDALREELAAVLRELRKLRAGGLVARLTEQEREEIALRAADRLEERVFPHGRGRVPSDDAPRRQTKRRFSR